MILPSKHISQERALLSVGATILQHLSEPITISALWEEMRGPAIKRNHSSLLRYDGFILALDLLFLVGAIDLQGGLLKRT